MIDFHCHLDLYPNPGAVIRECRSREMQILSVTTTPTAWRQTAILGSEAPGIRTALGLHPQLAHERKAELGLFEELIGNARYIGEVGLDGSPEFKEHWKTQANVLDSVLQVCRSAGGRVMSLHSRRAAGPVLDALERCPDAGIPVMHWFSGNMREVQRAATLGCWFSVGPAMLRGERGETLTARMPRDRVLTESDGPFAQAGGRALFPWDVVSAEQRLAAIWDVEAAEVTEIVRGNLERLVSVAGLDRW